MAADDLLGPDELLARLQRALAAGFIAPCLPTKAHEPPSGGPWLHEIKHDGFRIIACKSAESIFLYAFDPIELNCDDMRRDPLEVRKATLRSMLAKVGLGLRFNEHLEGDGSTVFRPRLQDGTRRHCVEAKGHRSGRSPDWLKMKNPSAAGYEPGRLEDE
jgi:ATP-dependent DNA ligase